MNKDKIYGTLSDYETFLGYHQHPSSIRILLNFLKNRECLIPNGNIKSRVNHNNVVVYKVDNKKLLRLITSQKMFKISYFLAMEELSVIELNTFYSRKDYQEIKELLSNHPIL